jgi:hypothetical protein
MNQTWEYSLVKGNGKENLIQLYSISYSGKSKTQFPFIVFDKKLGKYAEVHVFMISILKNTLLGFTWYGKQFRGTG